MRWSPRKEEEGGGVEGGGDWTVRSERRRWHFGRRLPTSPDSGLPLSRARRNGNERRGRGARKRRTGLRPTAALPRPAGHSPRTAHRLRLPRLRLSPAFFQSPSGSRNGHSAGFLQRPAASIAGRVLCSVVARPVAVGVAEVERRAGEDEPAAAGAAHLPAGDEGSEPLPQRPVRATVAACRRAPRRRERSSFSLSHRAHDPPAGTISPCRQTRASGLTARRRTCSAMATR